ncbi:Secreted beta-glucosidase sun1 [Ascosphaera acerosa]|nr:Secreted beta-glucosidase sun1 [Ascosphaera acerosa]
MKFSSAALVVAAGVVASAQPHGHRHAHHARDTTGSSGPIYAYKLDDRVITEAEACQGIRDGTLVWAAGAAPPADVCDRLVGPASHSTPAAQQAASATQAEEFFAAPETTVLSVSTPVPTAASSTSSPAAEPTTSSSPSTSSSSSAQTPSSTPHGKSSSGSSIFHATGLDAEFPDGEIDCDTFPSEYGAIALDYLNLGGWSGIQDVTIGNGVVNHIVTGISGPCKEGSMCSYSCPPGYQKSQWPATQGATGQSVGGLHCKNGKLHLTNPDLSKSLCIKGTGGVFIKNKLDDNVAVCRTDYPGTEAETVPLLATPSGTEELTCPDEATYYRWDGKATSAQYYVNPKGVSIEEGCVWGDGSKQVGNWAPVNLGVGYASGATWISIMANRPTTEPDLDFKIKIEGDNLSGECYFEDGKFYLNGKEMDNGCTVSFSEGEAYYVFY